MAKVIRLATGDDAEKILDIYSYYITSTAITFEYEVPSMDEFKNRMKKVQKQHPWLVYEVDGEVLGYAYASLHKERAAYQWNVELSVYLSHEHQGTGAGTKLYEVLLSIVTELGYHNAYGCITLPNDKSIALHKHFGFEEIGIFRNTGNKFNVWRDVIWLGKQLSEYENLPKSPIGISAINVARLDELMDI